MRILYAAMKYDYGKPDRGLSFEETNFRSALDGMGHEVIAFDFMERTRTAGATRMRRDLIDTAAELQPDVAFFCLFTNQLDVATIRSVGERGGCPTVNWFADDHWRFDDFSRHMAPAFDLAVTTDAGSLPRYAELPDVRVHLSQWACNRYAYSKVSDELRHDVTFVGQPHGDRREVIQALRQAGHDVQCWGQGWPNGRISHEAMVEVFSTSRINLNLSNSSHPGGVKGRLRRLIGLKPPKPRPPQIKGRNFEVPGCGGFLLTERLPHLEEYFEYERELGVYSGTQELIERVGHWLEHESERVAAAEAGHRRVLAEHTYDHRFAAIFAELGLASGSAATA